MYSVKVCLLLLGICIGACFVAKEETEMVASVVQQGIETAYEHNSLLFKVVNSPELYRRDNEIMVSREELVLRSVFIKDYNLLESTLEDVVGKFDQGQVSYFDQLPLSSAITDVIPVDVRMVPSSFHATDGMKLFGVVELYSPIRLMKADEQWWVAALGNKGGDMYGDWLEVYVFRMVGDELECVKRFERG